MRLSLVLCAGGGRGTGGPAQAGDAARVRALGGAGRVLSVYDAVGIEPPAAGEPMASLLAGCRCGAGGVGRLCGPAPVTKPPWAK